ncbi:MAG: LysR family transcriptional regulator [Pseudomonadota bacterium]
MSENLNRLAYFVAIAEEGTITAAAKRLRVSKAVVSKRLQLLEDDLGSTLVLRNSRHFSLTETGETFYEAANARRSRQLAVCGKQGVKDAVEIDLYRWAWPKPRHNVSTRCERRFDTGGAGGGQSWRRHCQHARFQCH